MNAALVYRDDGPVSLALGRLRAPQPWVFALLAAAAVVAVAGARLSHTALLAAASIAVVLGGAGSSAAHEGPLDWIAVPALRTAEYATVAIAAVSAGVSAPLVFAMLCAVAFHDYDTVDRVRQRGVTRTDRFGAFRLLGLGWDGRLLVVAIAVASGHPTPVVAALTAYLWLLFATESARGWLRRRPA